MIRQTGILYDSSRTRSLRRTIKIKKKGKTLDGNSGVGQALEFPSKVLKNKRPLTSDSNFSHSRLGTALIIFSILGFLISYGPIIQVELGYRLSRVIKEEGEQPKGGFGDLLNKKILGEVEGVPDPNFSLIIPKIHAKSKIVADVDASDEIQYMEALKAGVAHAKGTKFPGSNGTVYLFAHSTDSPINILRYNAVFYLLRELEPNDEIQVYFSGVKHRYLVFDKKIVEPTDVSYLSPFSGDGKELLILQTCWPPGTTFKRLLVFARKISI